ncbi:DHA1 family bicyclomycin/chloramphenicol resistance-like MFS transporter [Pontibacter aydingkolensis]|uniref:Multidrug effflux MFS transporter n=1 Tax=Pontibacter aydingkolensis TaxID=1911536 RepID=A0ABS7CUR7_9BACT|nr:multidrug effflux MFS transporter [Pontibacter aydingkolensis]MBW7467599.1 multidrug effflux MFS transporter [Pontibacter aydingkolensis]
MDKKQQNVIILILGALAALGPFAIDMYLPGFPAIAKDLNTDISHVALSLTSYFIGISVGQLIYGPLVDRFGRKKPLLVGLTLFIVAAIGCAFAPTVEWLIALRLLLALGGCVGMVASRAVVRDVFPVKDIPKVFSMLMLVMGVAPIIAPTIGGLVTAHLGWRYIFAVLSAIGLAVMLLIIFLLPESKGPDPTLSLKPKYVLADFFSVLKNPVFLTYAFAASTAQAGLFAYITGSPFVFMEIFGLSETHYGWVFGMNAFGFIAGSQFNNLMLRKRTSAQITLGTGVIQFMAGTLLLLGNYFGYLNPEGSLILIFCYLFCLGVLSPNASALALAPFARNAGSASALMGSAQMAIGAIASVIISALHNGTAIPMMGVMAGATIISVSLLLGFRSYSRRTLAITPRDQV